MNRAQIAEWILGLFLEPGRAAAYIGDLMEEAADHGAIWFWSSVVRLAIMRFWYDISESPFLLIGVLLPACVQNIVITFLIFVGFLVLLIPILLLAYGLHAVLAMPVPGSWVAWFGAIIYFAVTVLGGVHTGRWIAVRMPGREITACIAMYAVQPLFYITTGFLITWIVTRLWPGPIEHFMLTHPGPAESATPGLANTGLNYLITYIGLFVGALKTRSRSLRSAAQ